jgi:site-specific DNA-methyltransferase (adenine-specific)
MKNDVMFSSASDQWATPQEFFDQLNDEFHFTLDVCADETNHKCEKYFTKEQDGLKQDWSNNVVFCNPPYGRSVGHWVKKCADESANNNALCVMLINARTDTKWFHEFIYGKAEIRFVKGRLKFGDSKENAPFPSMVVIFKPRR